MAFIDPQATLLQLGLKEGMRVADFGCGSGRYALAASHVVGGTGRVYAVDIQEDILTRLKDDASRNGIENVDYVWADLEGRNGSTLSAASLDAVIMSNVLFQAEDKRKIVLEAKRVLKPKGTVLLIDWTGSHGGMGPAAHHVTNEEDAEALFVSTGFHKVKSAVAGAHHYAFVFSL